MQEVFCNTNTQVSRLEEVRANCRRSDRIVLEAIVSGLKSISMDKKLAGLLFIVLIVANWLGFSPG
jgi:hypothetical protein